MAQPACEQIVCERVGHRAIRNCEPVSEAFQKSFAEATVQHIGIKDRRAAVKFSNGGVVELGGPGWLIDKVGGNAGRGFFFE
jgi:hypothetical protein